MSEHVAQVEWVRGDADFGADYDRSHVWRFDGGVEVPASSAPALHGDPARVDPEEGFIASISSCHMLWFLHLASDAGLVVDRYRDDPVGTMSRASKGVLWVSDVDLRPVIEFSGTQPDAEQIKELHDESHRRCFIANSVRSTITVHGA
ncbi:OsmC family protein [soil metagenome]